MKKYIPLDFDEKGKVILGREKNTPKPNGTIPAIFIPGGSDENKHGLKSISISPAITTTPALDSLFPIYWEDLTEEQREDGVTLQFAVEQGIIKTGDEYMVTVTPTAELYAARMDSEFEHVGKGEPLTFTATPLNNDILALSVGAADNLEEPTVAVIANCVISHQG